MQFGRALAQLGITYIAANSPQAQGRIERLWGPLQDRFTSELRLAAATDRRGANVVLRRIGRSPRQAETAWRPAPADLDRICCFVHQRSVSNDNVVQWEWRRLQIPPSRSASALPVPTCRSTNRSKEKSRSITPIPNSTTGWITPQGVTFSRCYNRSFFEMFTASGGT